MGWRLDYDFPLVASRPLGSTMPMHLTLHQVILDSAGDQDPGLEKQSHLLK